MISNFYNIYSKHLIKKSFFIAGLVWLVMIFLDFSVTLVMDLENLSESLNFFSIFYSVLLEQPHKGLQYLESSMLIGTLITLSLFNQQGNLVFLRASGLSPLKIVLISGMGPLLLSLLIIFMDEAIFLQLAQKSKPINQAQSTEIFQWDLTDQHLIGLNRTTESNATSIQVIEFENEEGLLTRSKYEIGSLSEGQLLIESPEGEQVYNFPDSLLFTNIALEKMKLTDLFKLHDNYQLDGDVQKIESLIYARLFLPFSIIAIIFLAGSLMFSNARSGGVGRQIIIGISLGLIYDLLKDLSVASFLTYQWPILFAYILPVTILIAFGYLKFQRV